MQELIQIPVKEYEAMKETIALLSDGELVKKLSRLVDLLYEEKYGLYLGNDTSDLTAAALHRSFQPSNSPWDHV